MTATAARIPDTDVQVVLSADAPLSRHISIAAGFRRSINLERDQDAIELLQGYVPTSRALAALEQIMDLDPHYRDVAAQIKKVRSIAS